MGLQDMTVFFLRDWEATRLTYVVTRTLVVIRLANQSEPGAMWHL
jgi:hypothetical protein